MDERIRYSNLSAENCTQSSHSATRLIEPKKNIRSSCAETTPLPTAQELAMDLPVFKRSVKRSGMSTESFSQALVQSALSHLVMWTLADLENLLLTSERHGLNPLGGELYLMKDSESLEKPAVVVLGVDGWCSVLNTHEKFAGMQFKESSELLDSVPCWIECTLHRWDRRVPTRVREYYSEVRGNSLAWLTHPRRMLRHKALVQCARLAFGLVGVYDPDEAQRILDAKPPKRPGNVSKNESPVGDLPQKALGTQHVLKKFK